MSLIPPPPAGSNALRSRAYNRSLVLRHVRVTGASGRAQIARESGLSTQAVSNIIADLVAAAPHWLRPGGWIVIEDDPSRVDQTAQALAHHVGSSSVEPDLTGRDRFAMARRA